MSSNVPEAGPARRRSRISRRHLGYLAALLLPPIVLLLRLMAGFTPGDVPMLILFIVPTVASSYLGGWKPGVLATAISGGLTEYYLLRSAGRPPFVEAFDYLPWTFLIFLGVLLSVLAEALHRSRERFRAILDSSLDGVVVSDHAGRILAFNASAEAMFGYTAAQVLGREMGDVIVPPELREMHRRGMARYLATGDARILGKRIELSAMRSDGTTFPVELSIVRVGTVHPPIFTGFIRDLTEREQAKEAARRTERLYQNIFNQQFQFMAILEPDGRVREINNLPLRVSGLRREDFVGKFFWQTPNWSRLPEWQRIWPERLQQAACTNGPVLTEDIFQTASGETRYAEAATTAIRDQAGAVEYYIIQANDITERRTAERAVRELNASLEQRVEQRTRELAAANDELESFSYSVSHDLRSPLRSIAGFTQLLLRGAGDRLEEDERKMLERVMAATDRMSQLIDDLLKLAHMARADVVKAPVDLSAIVRSILDGLWQSSAGRVVNTEIEDGLVAEADARLIRIVLENLLGNAWKFTTKTPSPSIEFGSETGPGGKTIYYVRDNGAGFDMAYANKLFGPFQRLHRPDDYQGTGIGLATVQRIIQRHGGRIWAEAKLDEGATFRFTL